MLHREYNDIYTQNLTIAIPHVNTGDHFTGEVVPVQISLISRKKMYQSAVFSYRVETKMVVRCHGSLIEVHKILVEK